MQPRYKVEPHGWGYIVVDTEIDDANCPACRTRQDADALCRDINEDHEDACLQRD